MSWEYERVDEAERDRQLRGLKIEEHDLVVACRHLASRIRETASGVEDCEDAMTQEIGELLQHAADVNEMGLKLAVVRAEIAALER